MIITTSLMRRWSECPRQAALKARGLRPAEEYEPGAAMLFGQMLHEDVENFLLGTGKILMPSSFVQDASFIDNYMRTRTFYFDILKRGILDNDRVEVLAVEKEFRIPIVSPRPPRHKATQHDYAGKVDALLRIDGQVWIYELKTRASNTERDTAEFDQAPQATAYAYAFTRLLGEPVAGVIYHIVKRNPPRPPRILKSTGKVSKDKSQNTTAAMVLSELERLHLDPADYEEFLDHIAHKERENPFFREYRTFRTAHDLREFEAELFQVARLMVQAYHAGEPRNRFYCHQCVYNAYCNLGERENYVTDEHPYRELAVETLEAERNLHVAKLSTVLPEWAA